MKTLRRRDIVLGFVLFITLSVTVTLFFPALDDLMVENRQWNGLSEFYGEIKPVRVHTSEGIGRLGSNSTLFIVGPSRSFSADNIEAVERFLRGGGRVVLADDFGSGNQLLEGLGLDTRFSGELLLDSVFYKSVPEFPRMLNFTTFDVEEAVLNYATVLVDGDDLVVLEVSSPLSYLNVTGEIVPASYPVLGWVSYGEGRLYLLSDSSMFINTMIDEPYNRVLLERMVRGKAYVDTSHTVPSRLLTVKWFIDDLYDTLDGSVLLYLVILGVSIGLYYGDHSDPREFEVGEVEKVLSRFPEWDRERLEWLMEQRSLSDGDQ